MKRMSLDIYEARDGRGWTFRGKRYLGCAQAIAAAKRYIKDQTGPNEVSVATISYHPATRMGRIVAAALLKMED